MTVDGRPGSGPRVGQRASRSRLVARDDVTVRAGAATSLLDALVAEELPGSGGVLLRVDVHFLAPVRVGDVITGTVEVVAVRPAGTGPAVVELTVTVARDDGVVVAAGEAVCRTASGGTARSANDPTPSGRG